MRRWTGAVAAIVMLGITGAAMGCPMCKDSIPGSTDAAQAGSLPGGFNTSVYLMLTGFLAVLSLIVSVIVKGVRGTQQPAQGFPVLRKPQEKQN